MIKIETKYRVDQKVWIALFGWQDRSCSECYQSISREQKATPEPYIIEEINIRGSESSIVEYRIRPKDEPAYSGYHITLPGRQIFHTKEDCQIAIDKELIHLWTSST